MLPTSMPDAIPGDMVTDVAPETDQLSVEQPPVLILIGLAVKLTITGGVGGGVVGGSAGAGVDGLTGARVVLGDCCDGVHAVAKTAMTATNMIILRIIGLIFIDFFTTFSLMPYHKSSSVRD